MPSNGSFHTVGHESAHNPQAVTLVPSALACIGSPDRLQPPLA
jgi:hypothetical protein